MRRERYKILPVVICLVLMLSACNKSEDNTVNPNSPYGLLQKTSILSLTTSDQTNLSELDLKIPEDDKEQQSLIEFNTSISIKDSGDLKITVDNPHKFMRVSSDIEGKAEEVYNTIINELQNNKSKYLMLYSHLVTDKDGNILNITFNDDKILFDFSAFENVDTRFLDLYYTQYNTYGSGDGINNSDNGLVLSDVSDSTEFIVLKNDAIYGLANDQEGIDALKVLSELYTGKYLKLRNNVYKGINIEDTVETVNSVIEYPRNQEISLEITQNIDSVKELEVYFKEETLQFREDLTEYLEQAGFKVVIADNSRDCSVILGYTWLYNNSLQSSLDDRLANALINHHNKSGITDDSVSFLLRSSWGLGEEKDDKQ